MATKPKNRAERRMIIKSGYTSRDFKYALGDVKLEFSLRTDNPTQLKDFLACMEIAKADIEEELAKK